ncbi:Chitin binding Peritrophin-A domain [Popillia japonica]
MLALVNQQYEDFMLREAGNKMNMLALDMHYCLNNEDFSTHPKNCSKFLLYHNGILFLGICNSQKYFNPSSKRCASTYKCALGSSNQGDIGLPNQERLQWQNQQFGIFVFKNDSSLNLGTSMAKPAIWYIRLQERLKLESW